MIEPHTYIVDQNTEATVIHFAAHFGNLKFLRYLHKKYADADYNIFKTKDKYGLTITHYAARSGHLPVLMFCVEILDVPADIQDNFGNTAVDNTMIYLRLYCFIYLWYARKVKILNKKLCSNIAEAMATCHKEDSLNFVKLIMKTDGEVSLKHSLRKDLMHAAIKSGRADMVYEIFYEDQSDAAEFLQAVNANDQL